MSENFQVNILSFFTFLGGGGRVSHACVLGIPQQTDFDREVRFIESVVQENDRFWSEMGYPKELLAFAWDEADTFWCFDFSTDPSDGPVVRVCGTAANYAIGGVVSDSFLGWCAKIINDYDSVIYVPLEGDSYWAEVNDELNPYWRTR